MCEADAEAGAAAAAAAARDAARAINAEVQWSALMMPRRCLPKRFLTAFCLHFVQQLQMLLFAACCLPHLPPKTCFIPLDRGATVTVTVFEMSLMS